MLALGCRPEYTGNITEQAEATPILLGNYNKLRIIEISRDERGQIHCALDAGEAGSINLQCNTADLSGSNSVTEGALIDVFVYRNAARELVATTRRPLAVVGECASLRVADIGPTGAFLDWGIEQQILLPTSRQQAPLRLGQNCVVYLELDKASERVIASSKLSRYLPETATEYQEGDEVNLMVASSTSLGFKVIVDGSYLGLLYRDEVFQPLHPGQQLQGYVKKLRLDERLDLTLHSGRKESADALSGQILALLRKQGGKSNLTDKSAPEDIYQQYRVSKKVYKRALSMLYKQKKILIANEQISLNNQPDNEL